MLNTLRASPGLRYSCISQGDPVRDLVGKYQGEAEACKRHVLAADAVTADTRGLQQLVAAANYRAAINHTALLLEMYGQGEIYFLSLRCCQPTGKAALVIYE